jgi:hypothetical protein
VPARLWWREALAVRQKKEEKNKPIGRGLDFLERERGGSERREGRGRRHFWLRSSNTHCCCRRCHWRRRSTVPLTRGAGICCFPFASFRCSLFSFPLSPFALDPTPQKKKRKIRSETPREFGRDYHTRLHNRRGKEGSLTHAFG